MNKIILTDAEPNFDANSEDLAKIVTSRLGLLPRKVGSNEKMHKILIELYERTKTATREKKPEKAVMTVEEMAAYAGISKQTMYEYLERWLVVDFLVKISFIGADSKVIKGYKLNGTNLEEAFAKVKSVVENNLSSTEKHLSNLQKMLKNEKIRASMSKDIEKETSEISPKNVPPEKTISDPKSK
jgi:hypothetical protein